MRHLGLDDWQRVAIGEELDCVGPEAQKLLLRHGVLWPANVHFHLPQLERAAGGSVLTGIGGDEVFSDSGWERARLLLAGKVRPTPRDVLRLGLALAPQAVKRRRFMERNEVELDWLTPAAQAEIGAALAGEAASEPLGWRRRFGWLLGLRYLDIGTRSLGLLAARLGRRDAPSVPRPDVRRRAGGPAEGTSLRGPDRGALRAVRQRASCGSRVEELEGRPSRRRSGAPAAALFASSWDGSGVDPGIVDVDALRRRWQVDGEAWAPHAAPGAVARASGRREGVEQQLERRRHGGPGAGPPQLPGRQRAQLKEGRRVAWRHGDAAVARRGGRASPTRADVPFERRRPSR